MSEQTTRDDFTHADLPHVGKRVLRLGLAGNFGLQGDDILYAAERGVRFWMWSPTQKKITPALREVLSRDREQHVVAAFVGLGYTAGMVRRTVEKSLRLLDIEQIDLSILAWLGRTTLLTSGIQKEVAALKREGKIKAVGVSIHDRVRAGELARDSMLDAFMIRYNAKHPGAEQDIFPHLEARRPLMIAYTATSWRQLLKPISGMGPPLTAQQCYRFCLSSPHIHVTLTGPKDRAQLDVNLATIEAGPLSAEEEVRVRDYGREVKGRRQLPFV